MEEDEIEDGDDGGLLFTEEELLGAPSASGAPPALPDPSAALPGVAASVFEGFRRVEPPPPPPRLGSLYPAVRVEAGMVPGAPPPHAQPLRSSLPPAVAALLASKRAAPGGLVAYAQGQALGQKEAKAELRAQRAAGRARDAGYDSGGPRRKRQVIMDSEEEDGGSTSSEAEGGGGAAAAPRPQHAPAAPTGGGGADGDEYGEALKACAAIGARLKAKLGGTVLGGDGFGGADAAAALRAGLQTVTVADIQAACVAGSAPPGDVPPTLPPPPPPLKEYQVVGVNFLLLLHTEGVRGAILADEMGLGKTAQAISFIACVSSRAAAAGAPRRPHLVIAPASVLENWARELALWAPGLRVLAFTGSQANRTAVRASVDEEGGPRAPRFDVLLACYTSFERDTPDQVSDRKWLRSFRFAYAVLDEAHLVKNRSSQRARKLRRVLTDAAANRLMLTGTPLQNDLEELLALLELLMPNIFDGSGALLDGGRGGDGDDSDEGGDRGLKRKPASAASAKSIERVRTMLGPFVLRRLKNEVLNQLVPKTQYIERIPQTAEQQGLYDAAVASVRSEIAAKARARKGAAAGERPSPLAASEVEAAVGSRRLKALFTHLRKVANHPLLVRHHFNSAAVDAIVSATSLRGVFGTDAPLRKVREHVAALSDFALHQLCADSRLKGELLSLRLDPELVLRSGKANRLGALLPQLKAAGSRPLIFSQWKIMLDVLEAVLFQLGLSFFRLDGDTPVGERQAMVDAFNAPGSPVFAFLLTTRAGGQGINLTGADTVVLHDCDFNPQIDRQAEDRAHRLGQTRPVSVYRFVSEGTVDAKIVDIAERKLSLDAAVLDQEEIGTMAELLKGLLDSSAPEEQATEVAELATVADDA